MFIKKIQLEEFKRHAELEVELSRGVNAICGPNGVGKSSIIEAIGFALFDHCPYRARTELIRKGAKRAKILVEFESPVDQMLYLVERSISSAGNSRYTVRDALTASVLADGTGDCQELLVRLMGAEEDGKLPRLFDSILGVPQGTITAAFMARPAERKAVFAPLLRVEEYERAWGQMKQTFLDPLQLQHHQQEVELRLTRERLVSLPDKEREHQKLCDDIDQAEAVLKALEARLPGVEEARTALQAQQTALHQALQQKQMTAQRATQLRDQRERAHQALAEAKAAQAVLERTATDHKEYLEARPKHEAMQAQMRSNEALRERLRKLDLQRHQQQHELDQCQSQLKALDDAEREIAELSPVVEAYQIAEKERERLQQQLSTLPFLKERLVDLRLTLQAHRADEAALLREKEQLVALQPAIQKLREVEDSGKGLKQRVDQWQRDERERAEIQKRLHQLQSQSQATRTRLDQAQREETNLRRNLQPLAERLDEHEARLRQLQQQLDRLIDRRERDAAFRKNVSGGICPYFEQTCQNVPPGQKLEQYLQSSIQRSDQEARQLEKRAREAREARDEARKAQQKLHQEAPRHRAQIESDHRELERLAQQQREQQQEQQKRPSREQDIQQASQQLQALRQEFKTLRSQSEKAQGLPAVQDRLERLQKDIQSREQEQKRLEIERKALEALEPQLATLRKEQERRQKDVDRHRDRTRELTRRPELQQRSRRLQETIASLDQERQPIEKTLKEQHPDEAQLQQLAALLRRTEAGYTEYLQHQKLAGKSEELQQRHDELQAQQQAAQAEAEQAQRQAEEKQAAFSPEKLRELDGEWQQLVSRQGELRGSLPKDRTSRDRLSEEISQLKTQQATLDAQAESHRAMGHTIECGQLLRRVIKDAAPHMTRALIRSISAEADRLFRHLLDQNHLHLQWDETFELRVEEEGQDRSFHNLSGGEQMAAALAVRLALIKELSSIRLAFFDEPTAHLDAERRYNLAAQLSQVQGFEQLVVISHDDTFETMTDHVVWLRPN